MLNAALTNMGGTTAIASVVGMLALIVAVLTFVRTVLEYIKGNALKRFEKFQEMRKRFEEKDGSVNRICVMLLHDPKALECLEYPVKEDFLGFFEEIALMKQSGLISNELTHYMFGYYAIRAWKSAEFKKGINLDAFYWALFVRFSKNMAEMEDQVTSGSVNVEERVSKLRF